MECGESGDGGVELGELVVKEHKRTRMVRGRHRPGKSIRAGIAADDGADGEALDLRSAVGGFLHSGAGSGGGLEDNKGNVPVVGKVVSVLDNASKRRRGWTYHISSADSTP